MDNENEIFDKNDIKGMRWFNCYVDIIMLILCILFPLSLFLYVNAFISGIYNVLTIIFFIISCCGTIFHIYVYRAIQSQKTNSIKQLISLMIFVYMCKSLDLALANTIVMNDFTVNFVEALLVYGIYYIPNIIYFYKRKDIFRNNNTTEDNKKVKKSLEIVEELSESKNEEIIKDETHINNKHYVSKKFIVIWTLLILVIISTIFGFIYWNVKDKYEQLEKTKNDYSKKLDELQENYGELKKTNYELNNKILDYEDKVNFVDNCVVIVPQNTNIYHRYDCQYLDKKSLALVFNIENARGQGYVPCKNCIK